MSGTSNISLRYFSEIAKQSGDGVVRFSMDRHGEERLINKGTLGSRIATFFDIEEKATQDDRNRRALQGFRESLKASYGEFGTQALERLGLSKGTELKGTDVLNAIQMAGGLWSSSNRKEVMRHRDEKLYQDVYDGVKEALQEKSPKTVDTGLKEFVNRVTERCRFESDLYRVKLTDEKIKELAGEEARQMLATNGNFTTAVKRNSATTGPGSTQRRCSPG